MFRLTSFIGDGILRKPGQTDDLSKTMNYAEVYEMCKNIVEREAVHLIETVLKRWQERYMTDFAEKVNGVRVVLIKPDPPIRGHYSSVSVEITRGRFS